MKSLPVRFGSQPHQDPRVAAVLSARGLNTPQDVDRFLAAHGGGNPKVVALRHELGPSGKRYVRQLGSTKI